MSLVVLGMLLKCRPVGTHEECDEIKPQDPERVDDHAQDRQMDGIGDEHQSYAEHYREHCGLVGIGAMSDREIPRHSHWHPMREATPPCRDNNKPLE